ncbi:polysaccharide biosynthesis protein [Rhodococcus oxybenzonivorans]|uniref:polysaccharide biosynthesis protein n=1 Tax=Rhodococcus oxybenzonivorans TaxID=1990687 RepID=UPI002953791B|nr:polysaccharide biosynthesis protein [Rhodococcus oxybenzonivorans]MDV7357237.1 polysaccharide biosynthesis protein [Rhodococcus oxybenzonivorans]
MGRMTRQSLTTSAVAGVTMVTAGSMVANVASYLLHLPASRWLGPAGYGEFASLLAAQLVLAVPALALQTVVAREVVRGRGAHAVRQLGYRCAVIVGIAALLLAPGVAWALETGMRATVSALITAPVLVLLATEQGLLQGAARFGPLSIVLAGAGIAKVVPAVVVLAVGGGPGFALAASAVGTGVVALAARVFADPDPAGATSTPIGVAAVLKASQVQLALIALSSMDLVLARIVLSNDDAGLYALGAVATKAAFWLPQAVGVVLYPRMANPAHSVQAVRSAIAVLVGLGAVLVAVVAVSAPLVPLLVGEAYQPVQSLLWLFALQGACLAVLQGALLSAIAGERTYLAVIAWIGFAVEMAGMLTLASTVGQFIGVAVTVAASTAVVASVLAVRSARHAVAV